MTENIYIQDRIDTQDLPIATTGPDYYELPSLEEVLDEFHPLPAYSIMLGICEDGLPLVLDLMNHSSGSVLIAGDHATTNFNYLYSLFTSAFLVNTPEEVNLHLISPQADELTELHQQPAFKISFDPTRPECEMVVEEMVNLVHQRQGDLETRPIHILGVDGMDDLMQTLSPEAQYWMKWLVTNGPQVGLWTIATVESSAAYELPRGMVDSFPSRILSNIQSSQVARSLSGLSRNRLDDLVPGEQFFVRSANGSHKIWMLQPEV